MKLHLRLLITFGALLVTGSGQGTYPVPAGLVFKVRGGEGVRFSGDYLATSPSGDTHHKAEGTVPAEFTVDGTDVFLSIQNQSQGREPEVRVDANGNGQLDKDSPAALNRPFLEVEIAKNGTTIKKQRTDAPFGVVSLASVEHPGGRPRQAEYTVDGSVKYAMLTITSDTGDIEQQLVPIPNADCGARDTKTFPG